MPTRILLTQFAGEALQGKAGAAMAIGGKALLYRVKAHKSRVQAESSATIKRREEHLKLAADYDALADFYERTVESDHKLE